MSMSADVKSQFRAGAKVCSGAVMVLLVIGALGPESWNAPHGAGLAVRPLPGVFVHHIVCLLCLAPAVRGRESPDGRRVLAGRSAGFYTGSDSQCCGRTLRRGRGADSGSHC